VKKSHRWAVLATIALFLCFLISLAVAQGPGAAPSAQPATGPRIALLDVTYIIKNHERFKARMDEMMKEGQNAQKKLQAERADIISTINGDLQQYNKGTPEYQSREEVIANRQAKLAIALQRLKEEYQQREAQIYYDTYQEIMRSTDYFCKQHGIDMVLRFEGEKSDPKFPESVIADIRKTVVWYDSRWVITKFILDDLNRTPVAPPRGTEAADGRGAPAAQARPVSPYNNIAR
jgi:Skp family chaperone for outer membrane proteins